MELYLQLNKITDEEYAQIKLQNMLSITKRLENNLHKKRKNFSQRLKNIKKHVMHRACKNAFNIAREDFLQKFLSSNDIYKNAILNANKDCLELSLKIAKEIINEEIIQNKNILSSKIKNELKKIHNKNDYKITCNENTAIKIKDTINFSEIIIDNFIPENIAYLSSSAGSIEIDIENEFKFLSNKLHEDLKNLC